VQDVLPTDIALVSLALAIVAHGIAWFFKTPKEASKEVSLDLKEAEKALHERVNKVEDSHIRLERQYIRSSVELGEKVKSLAEAIRELSTNVRTLTSRMDNHHVGTNGKFQD
jgi:predicted  nucleic acid-binding Zn-ribbon protein